MSMKPIGCTDCGKVYRKRSDVPKQCRGYAVYVRRNKEARFGYEITMDEDPFYPGEDY